MEEIVLGIIKKLCHIEEEKLYFILKITENELDKKRNGGIK
ncbi:hypothetical protein [Turicibacter sanguinis]